MQIIWALWEKVSPSFFILLHSFKKWNLTISSVHPPVRGQLSETARWIFLILGRMKDQYSPSMPVIFVFWKNSWTYAGFVPKLDIFTSKLLLSIVRLDITTDRRTCKYICNVQQTYRYQQTICQVVTSSCERSKVKFKIT